MQLRPVTMYCLFAKGTVETKILQLHRVKWDVASQVLDTDKAALSTTELMALMEG